MNTLSHEEIKERTINYDFALNDGLDLLILLKSYHNLIDEYRVYENYIDVYEIGIDELEFFDGDDYMRIYTPQNGKLNITLFVRDKDTFQIDYLGNLKEYLTEYLGEAITFDEIEFTIEVDVFNNRLQKISSECLPFNIDRTEAGEFVIFDAEYGEEDYVLNEECYLTIDVRGSEVNAYYYSDADVEYKFHVDVNESMGDDEIRNKLVKGFSEKFGWVDLFTEEETPKGVDVRFWASVYDNSNGDDIRTLIELNRELFDLNQEVTSLVGAQSEEGEEEFDEKYTDLCEKVLTFIIDKKLPEFSHLNQDDFFVEFLRLDEEDKSDCAFIAIGIVDLRFKGDVK